MKKKIALLTILFLITSYLFAGDYDYMESHKTFGTLKLHIKVYVPKGTSEQYTRDELQDYINIVREQSKDKNVQKYNFTYYVSIFTFREKVYRVIFSFDIYNQGIVSVFKNSEMIYQFTGTRYSTFNTFYDVYQSQCNKYLNMY